MHWSMFNNILELKGIKTNNKINIRAIPELLHKYKQNCLQYFYSPNGQNQK